jgi:hypothetical protein
MLFGTHRALAGLPYLARSGLIALTGTITVLRLPSPWLLQSICLSNRRMCREERGEGVSVHSVAYLFTVVLLILPSCCSQVCFLPWLYLVPGHDDHAVSIITIPWPVMSRSGTVPRDGLLTSVWPPQLLIGFLSNGFRESRYRPSALLRVSGFSTRGPSRSVGTAAR